MVEIHAPVFVRGRPLETGALVLGIAYVVALLWGLVGGTVSLGSLRIFLWQGIITGLVIGMAGVGLSMTYSILGFANFAHGEYLTVGAFGGWVASYLVAGLGSFAVADLVLLGRASSEVNAAALGLGVFETPLAMLVGMGFAAVATTAAALALDSVVYRPMRDQDGIALLIASVGVAFILRYLLVLVFGTGLIGVTPGSGDRFQLPVVGISTTTVELVVIVVGLLLVAAFHLVLQYTKLGKAMRAMADNEDLARVTGVPTERVVRNTWIVGASLTGVAGYLLVLWRGTLTFDMGWGILLLIFAAVILGGIGSPYGAVLGGLTIGVASRSSLVWLPAEFVNATAFGVMIIVLIVRPTGIFSGRTST